MADDRDVAGLLVDLGLDGGAVELEERGAPAERVAGLGLLARLPDPDELAAEPPEARLSTSRMGMLATGSRTTPWSTTIAASSNAVEPGGHRAQLRLDVAAGGEHGVAHEDRRAAGRRLLVVGHDGRVAHDDA